MDFQMGFHLLRPLGGDGQGAYITLPALTAMLSAVVLSTAALPAANN
jgi:hypothetical protein